MNSSDAVSPEAVSLKSECGRPSSGLEENREDFNISEATGTQGYKLPVSNYDFPAVWGNAW